MIARVEFVPRDLWIGVRWHTLFAMTMRCYACGQAVKPPYSYDGRSHWHYDWDTLGRLVTCGPIGPAKEWQAWARSRRRDAPQGGRDE